MKIIDKIKWHLTNPFYYLGLKRYNLIVFDDYFPNPVTGFRICEFFELLKAFRSIKIIVTPITYKFMGLTGEDFDRHLETFIQENPAYTTQIKRIKRVNNINTRLLYFVFLNNGRRIIGQIEKKRIKFVFTLYPGGGFRMDDTDSDKGLETLMSSKYFVSVIVNQQCIKNYLLAKGFCKEHQIHYIHGLPTPKEKLEFDIAQKPKIFENKQTIDICFAAAKNLPDGSDKGYDLFIKVATLLRKKHQNIKFHVLGGFSKSDIDVSAIEDIICFYGYIGADIFPNFLKQFDIILSPNRPNMLGTGSFDGFPLGTCVEASLVGCVIVATDELSENNFYTVDEEIIIIKPIVEDIMKKMENLLRAPEKIRQVGLAGMKRTQEIYSFQKQITSRIAILNDALKS